MPWICGTELGEDAVGNDPKHKTILVTGDVGSCRKEPGTI